MAKSTKQKKQLLESLNEIELNDDDVISEELQSVEEEFESPEFQERFERYENELQGNPTFDGYRFGLNDANYKPLVDREEAFQLFLRMAEGGKIGQKATDEFYERMARWVRRIVFGKWNRHGPHILASIFSECWIVFMQNYKKYNPEKHSVQQFFFRQISHAAEEVFAKEVGVDKRVWREVRKLGRVYDRIAKETGKAPDTISLALATGEKASRINELLSYMSGVNSTISIDDEENFKDMADTAPNVDPASALINKDVSHALKRALSKLSADERTVFLLSNGVSYNEDGTFVIDEKKTNRQIHNSTGIPLQLVERYRNTTFSRLRNELRSYSEKEYEISADLAEQEIAIENTAGAERMLDDLAELDIIEGSSTDQIYVCDDDLPI